ncbi:unnamed protein product [Ceratitis capitata]|uniref:Coiled-coil domain-containing protein 22 homolog n=1 Tax=Ceratitis capitata TaxID=7213 RepID=W8BMV2_CERCA|nr:unnamed protein product [Ceratitis capitata]
MDEVDKIIVHSLNQIGCHIDDQCTMADFTPTLLVRTVSQCLKKIQPLSTNIPQELPEGLAMAQRFSIATTMSAIISNLNYRGDIGYQTFLYPNVVDVRKLLMFLIEKIPRDEVKTVTQVGSFSDDLDIWRKNVKETIAQQLRKPWIPQYCRNVAPARNFGFGSQITHFKPHHNLMLYAKKLPLQNDYATQHKIMNIFQQTAKQDFDLISSVLHQNSFDLYLSEVITSGRQLKISPQENYLYIAGAGESGSPTLNDLPEDINPLSKLTAELNNLKGENAELLAKRKILINNINSMKDQQNLVQKELECIRPEVKIHERASLVLDNPKENIAKLETLIQTVLERRKNLDQQWQDYRKPMLDRIETMKCEKHLSNAKNAKEFSEIIKQLEQDLYEKKVQHNQLSAELRAVGNDRAAPRNEYIHRILEFISNIRKQRNDIYKVLDDTRDLQKQLNSISAQLQRQFCYTDDLLFQTAKHDAHSKLAYKLLATLHSTCNELVDLVAKTGNVTNSSREIEVQIDREKTKNVTESLEQITADIRNFENLIHNIQTEIRGIENEISKA